MSSHCAARQRAPRQLLTALAACVAAVCLASPVAAMPQAASTHTGASNAAQLCALVIQINTKYGAMKNKRFIPISKVTPSVWKAVVDAAVRERSHLLAVSPSDIKKAVTHELAWFAHIKANHYAKSTPLAPLTIAEAGQITNFERTKCGIKF
jgi:hypothetical protein